MQHKNPLRHESACCVRTCDAYATFLSKFYLHHFSQTLGYDDVTVSTICNTSCVFWSTFIQKQIGKQLNTCYCSCSACCIYICISLSSKTHTHTQNLCGRIFFPLKNKIIFLQCLSHRPNEMRMMNLNEFVILTSSFFCFKRNLFNKHKHELCLLTAQK